jgi:cell division transport system permease protein
MERAGYVLRKLWQNIRHDGTTSLVNVLVLTLTFFTVLVVAVGIVNLNRVTRSIEDRYQITVYLEDGLGEQRTAEVAEGLAQVEGIRDAIVLGPKSFRERFLSTGGAGMEGVEDVSLDVFPTVIEVQLAPDYRSRMDLPSVAARIGRVPGVETVETHEGWLARLKGLVTVLGLVALVFGASVLAAAVLIVANTVKLAFIKRQPLVEVMRLFGASNSFIEAPVVLEGFLQGMTGALVSVLMTWGLTSLVDSRLAEILGPGAWHLSFLPLSWAALFLALCGAVGILGAHLASARTLRV